MLREQLAAAELVKNLIKGNTDSISRVTYVPQKPSFYAEKECGTVFPRKSPESEGISSRRIAAFFEELAGDEKTDLHHVMVLRHGAVIGEASVAPYEKDIWHASYSMCKTVTGMAIGMLIDEGKLNLDEKVVQILDRKFSLTGIRQKNLNVEHLLTMTAGVSYNELGIVSGDDWTSAYLQASVKGTPGEAFEYNSMNSYILSAIVTKITGETMMEYLRPRLWEPLGIRNVYWETCPKGINKGGWGLFISTEDAAKLGQLYLQKGKWDGRQLISEEWVKLATSHHADTPEHMGLYGYGYQLWLGSRPGSYTFNGMLGQNVVVYPDLEMVVATNAGSDELFQRCRLLDIVGMYFEGDFQPEESLPEDAAAFRKLKETELGLSRDGRKYVDARRRKQLSGRRLRGIRGTKEKSRTWNRSADPGQAPEVLERKRFFRNLDGRRFYLDQTHVGVCPLVFQVLHNNYTDGVRFVGFYKEKNRLFMTLEEGDSLHRLEIGFGKAAVTEVWFHEEPYLLAVEGEFKKDEDDVLVLKLDLAFLEEAVRRKLKCSFLNDWREIEIRWDETPGSFMIQEGLESVVGDVVKSGFLDALQNKMKVDIPGILIDRTIHPVVNGRVEEEISC